MGDAAPPPPESDSQPEMGSHSARDPRTKSNQQIRSLTQTDQWEFGLLRRIFAPVDSIPIIKADAAAMPSDYLASVQDSVAEQAAATTIFEVPAVQSSSVPFKQPSQITPAAVRLFDIPAEAQLEDGQRWPLVPGPTWPSSFRIGRGLVSAIAVLTFAGFGLLATVAFADGFGADPAQPVVPMWPENEPASPSADQIGPAIAENGRNTDQVAPVKLGPPRPGEPSVVPTRSSATDEEPTSTETSTSSTSTERSTIDSSTTSLPTTQLTNQPATSIRFPTTWPTSTFTRSTTARPPTTKTRTTRPTTTRPTTTRPTTTRPTTVRPTTARPTTVRPTTARSTTVRPTTARSTTARPTSAPTSVDQSTSSIRTTSTRTSATSTPLTTQSSIATPTITSSIKTTSANEPASSAANSSSSSATQPTAVYENCAAVFAAGVAPLASSDPGYRLALDRDRDGVACELG